MKASLEPGEHGAPCLLVIAGEASSDLHCASLLKELKTLHPGISFVGIGGNNMQEQGVELIAHAKELGVVGVFEVLKKLRRVLTAYRSAVDIIRSGQITTALFVDYPEFNLKLAGHAHRSGIPVLYYISPQVWAWRPGRIKKIARLVDKILVLFSFEKQLYDEVGLDVEFVGHPLLDTVAPSMGRREFLDELNLDPSRRLVLLLPGSRSSEIENLLPPFLEAARLVTEESGPLSPHVILALADTIERGSIGEMIADHPHVTVVQGKTYNALNASDVAMVASGTATLEAAILGVPMVVGYRVSPATYLLGRVLVRVSHVALPNIIAGREIVPELLQNELTPSGLAERTLALLRDEGARVRQKQDLKSVTDLLGERGASKRAAAAVSEFLDSVRSSHASV
ncbi:MAG: lipid-A-disaccharide synthase [Candidatus Coatesbacteria bacterium]|nr:lipid-A-disaccharide synthase [Candidatus Coatesbacteria bacterium]